MAWRGSDPDLLKKKRKRRHLDTAVKCNLSAAFDSRLMRKKSTESIPQKRKQGIMCPLFEMQQQKKKNEREREGWGGVGGVGGELVGTCPELVLDQGS